MREKRKNSPILSATPERNVGLEVIHYEGVGVEGFCREGISIAEGGGALEGSQE